MNTFAFVERWAYCHNDSLSYPKFTVVIILWYFIQKFWSLFCPLKPWYVIQFHQFIIHRVVFVSCNQKIIFVCKLLSSISYQEKVRIISGQNLAIPVTVIWWNRNPSWKKECQMKFDRQRTPVISGKHDWTPWVQKISEVEFIFLSTNLYGHFWAYVGEPHGHIGYATSMPFASINPTNPRTNPWNFGGNCSAFGEVEKLSFFESAILNFFCFIPMKISHKLCVRMDGTQFLL